MNKTEKKIQAFCKEHENKTEDEKWQRYEEAKNMIPERIQKWRHDEYIQIITKALKI